MTLPFSTLITCQHSSRKTVMHQSLPAKLVQRTASYSESPEPQDLHENLTSVPFAISTAYCIN